MMKRFLPTGLYWRTFLIFVIPVLLLQIAVTIVFFERHWSKMTERLAFSVAGEISAAISYVDEFDDDVVDRLYNLASQHLDMQIHYSGEMLALPNRSGGLQKHRIIQSLKDYLELKINYPYEMSYYPDRKIIFVDILTNRGGVNFVIPEGRLYSASSYIFILWVVGLSIILFSVALLFMRNQIRPIYRLGLIAERLGRGIPVGRFKPTGAQEVRLAGEAFIRMQDRINEYMKQRTTMLAGVSHDLKTPLTRMKLQLELMDDTPDTQAIKDDIHDMEGMISGYLAFAKGDGDEPVQRIELNDILSRVSQTAVRLGLNVEQEDLSATQSKMVHVKPQAIERAFNNFITNAAQHAQIVHITTEISDDSIVIRIDDNGDGINEDIIKTVLDPFVRGETSRNQKTGGVGLGLTIANDIIVGHGGTLLLSNSSRLGGLCVSITLPM